jgi:hypothetical protein
MKRAIVIAALLACYCRAQDAGAWWNALAAGGAVAERIDFGAHFHLDASAAVSLEIVEINATNHVVTQWNDWRNNGLYASQSVLTKSPFIGDKLNGRETMSFGVYEYQVFSDSRWMTFSERNTNIRSVFMVFRDNDYATGANFILSDMYSYDFHRGDWWNLFYSVYVSQYIKDGEVRIDQKEKFEADYGAFPTGFHIISLVTTGSVIAGTLQNDRDFGRGGSSYAEILIFNESVSQEKRLQIESYLSKKWGIPLTP